MPPRVHNTSCCVSTCLNTSVTRPDLSFFNLPADKDKRVKWLLLIGRKDLRDLQPHFRYYSVCEEHFSPDSIIVTNIRKLLKRTTLPTLCLPTRQEKNEKQTSTVSISTSTEDGAFNSSQLIEPSSQQKLLEQSVVCPTAILEYLSKKHLKQEFTELIKCDEKVTTSRLIVNRYESYRQFCLSLYYGSSQGYRLLQNAVHLPKVSAIYKHIPITTEINERLLNALQLKIESMSSVETPCIAVIDSMPLTPNLSYSDKTDKIFGFHEINGTRAPIVAERALVMIIHGMFVEWHQPVGYALLSHNPFDKKIGHWINDLVTKLCDMGLQIRILSFVSKIEADFFEERWVSTNVPFFFMKKRKVHYICEPKMLLNSLRNDLSLYDIHYHKDRVAKFEYIEQFFNKDKNCPYRLAPNLTDSHIHPTDPDKNDAVELFSRTVASGISAYIDFGQIDKSGRDTVELILKISDLISLFNSSNDINSNNRVFNGDQSHIQFLKEMKTLFEDLKLIDSKTKQDVTQTAKFLRGFLMNIISYLRLTEELMLENNNCSRVPIRTLNQGLTDDFFKQIRFRSNAAKPSAEQFGIAFRQLFILKAIKPLKAHNSRTDHKIFFKRAKKGIVRQATSELAKYLHELKDVPHFISNDIPNSEKITMLDSDYNHIDRTERHTLIYVSGYLLKKCKENHRNCEAFKNYADGTSAKITLNHVSRYLVYSQKNQICLMSIPCNHFVIIVEFLEDIFRKTFKRNYMNCNIEQVLYEEIAESRYLKGNIPPCPCFPWNYLIKLFIRLRITYTIHLNNRDIERNKKYFVIPLLLSDSNIQKL